MNIIDTLMGLFETSGIGAFFNGTASIKNIIMILVASPLLPEFLEGRRCVFCGLVLSTVVSISRYIVVAECRAMWQRVE